MRPRTGLCRQDMKSIAKHGDSTTQLALVMIVRDRRQTAKQVPVCLYPRYCHVTAKFLAHHAYPCQASRCEPLRLRLSTCKPSLDAIIIAPATRLTIPSILPVTLCSASSHTVNAAENCPAVISWLPPVPTPVTGF
jgi:hypothetical protein